MDELIDMKTTNRKSKTLKTKLPHILKVATLCTIGTYLITSHTINSINFEKNYYDLQTREKVEYFDIPSSNARVHIKKSVDKTITVVYPQNKESGPIFVFRDYLSNNKIDLIKSGYYSNKNPNGPSKYIRIKNNDSRYEKLMEMYKITQTELNNQVLRKKEDTIKRMERLLNDK